MKHIKTFENSKIPKYHLNDYVLLNINKIINDENFSSGPNDDANMKKNSYKRYGKIISKPIIDNDVNKTLLYDIAYMSKDFKLIEIDSIYILEDYIIRKLNEKEIDDINFHLTANKYNI